MVEETTSNPATMSPWKDLIQSSLEDGDGGLGLGLGVWVGMNGGARSKSYRETSMSPKISSPNSMMSVLAAFRVGVVAVMSKQELISCLILSLEIGKSLSVSLVNIFVC